MYEGETYNGKIDRNVYGRTILSDGSYYIGYYLNGNFNGQGSYTSAVNITYNGEWQDGVITMPLV